MSVKTKPRKVVLRIGLRRPHPLMNTDLQGMDTHLGFVIPFKNTSDAIDCLRILIARLERLDANDHALRH
jgi:hypothetical protein